MLVSEAEYLEILKTRKDGMAGVISWGSSNLATRIVYLKGIDIPVLR